MPENEMNSDEIEEFLAFPKLLNEYIKLGYEIEESTRSYMAEADPIDLQLRRFSPEFLEKERRLKKRYRFLEEKIDEFDKKYLKIFEEKKQHVTSEMLERKYEETLPPSLRSKYMVIVNYLKESEQWEKENPEWRKELQQWKEKRDQWKKGYEQRKKEYEQRKKESEQWEKENPEEAKRRKLRRLKERVSDRPRLIKTELRKDNGFEDDF